MSLQRTIYWSSARRDLQADRTKIPAGLLAARGLIECFARTRRPLVVAGKFDRAAIMVHAAAAAKAHQGRTGCTWGEEMSVSLKAAWKFPTPPTAPLRTKPPASSTASAVHR